MSRASQFGYSLDFQHIGANALNICTHGHQHPGQLLDIRFAGSIVDCGLPFRQNRSHENVCGTSDRCLIQKHIAAFKMVPLRNMKEKRLLGRIIILDCTEIHHSKNVGINPAASDFISSRLRKISPSETCQERTYNHHRATKLGTFCNKISTCNIFCINIIRPE